MMRAAEHNPAFAKKVGISSAKAKEIADATPGLEELPERARDKSKKRKR
jgi:hypothetical protein